MHVIYSDTIKGAGLVGGGPFGVPLKEYNNNDFNTSTLIEKSDQFAEMEQKENLIDDLTHLSKAPVWHLKESADKIIGPNYQEAVQKFYEKHGANITSV